jgi:hypothetical protein
MSAIDDGIVRPSVYLYYIYSTLIEIENDRLVPRAFPPSFARSLRRLGMIRLATLSRAFFLFTLK